jgi:hypothetical protein
MPEMLEPHYGPDETEPRQPQPTEGGRPGPDADPQPTSPAQPAPRTARPDTPPEEDLDPRQIPLPAPGPGESGGEMPTVDPITVTGV